MSTERRDGLWEGDRITLDGRPGTIGEGWLDGRIFVMDIKMDSGEIKCIRSGSNRIERIR